jgi:putative resolvase
MKAKEVLKILKITRQTLCKYVKQGKIRVEKLPNGYYLYNAEDVYKFLNKTLVRKNVIYARVSTSKQKKDLENQVETLREFCNKNGIIVNDVYKDIGSGINFDRKEFERLLTDVIEFQIQKVYITYKDRLSRISFEMFKKLFERFHCEIAILNDIEDNKQIEKEIITEIIDLIHCFSMKMYSKRRKEKFQLTAKELELEQEVCD